MVYFKSIFRHFRKHGSDLSFFRAVCLYEIENE